METNEITQRIIGCAIEVHKKLGPGLLESEGSDYNLSGTLCLLCGALCNLIFIKYIQN